MKGVSQHPRSEENRHMWRTRLRILICGAVCAAGVSRATAAEPPTILTIGDSITEGAGHFTCYRQILVPALQEKGIDVRFIGPKRDAASAHAGFSGKNTHFLREWTEQNYQHFPADVVLIHSGHNSFSRDKPVPGIVRDTEAMIRHLRSVNRAVVILLAQVILAGKLPKYDYIPELNRELAKLAQRLNDEGLPITLVNQANGFDWKTDTVQDKVHPNAAGAKKMADKWLAALLPILEQKK